MFFVVWGINLMITKSCYLFSMKPQHSDEAAQWWHVYTVNSLTKESLLQPCAHPFATLCLQATNVGSLASWLGPSRESMGWCMGPLASSVPLYWTNTECSWREQVRYKHALHFWNGQLTKGEYLKWHEGATSLHFDSHKVTEVSLSECICFTSITARSLAVLFVKCVHIL